MIRPLRGWHRRIVSGLSVLLPVAFAVGLAARRSVPVAALVPPELKGAASTSDFSRGGWTRTDLWPGHRIITRLRRDAAGSAAVELMSRDLVKPDVLVYWAAGKGPAIEGWPDNARLLGALANLSPLPIPADVSREAGRFVLYSLADHEVVAASKTLIVEKP